MAVYFDGDGGHSGPTWRCLVWWAQKPSGLSFVSKATGIKRPIFKNSIRRAVRVAEYTVLTGYELYEMWVQKSRLRNPGPGQYAPDGQAHDSHELYAVCKSNFRIRMRLVFLLFSGAPTCINTTPAPT